MQARVTDLERTLIDVTLRPAYAGGVFEVPKAYALARERVSVNKLVTMLRNLEFAYPYHQAIDYYLERSGYTASQLALVRRLPFEHDLYLAHDMGRTRYEAELGTYSYQRGFRRSIWSITKSNGPRSKPAATLSFTEATPA